MSDSLQPLWTVAHQTPLSMEFARQEYWSGLPLPSPGYLRNLGTEPRFPALQAGSLPSEPPGKPILLLWHSQLPAQFEPRNDHREGNDWNVHSFNLLCFHGSPSSALKIFFFSVNPVFML